MIRTFRSLVIFIAICLCMTGCAKPQPVVEVIPTGPPTASATSDLAATNQFLQTGQTQTAAAQSTLDAEGTQEAAKLTKSAQETQAAINRAGTSTAYGIYKQTATAGITATAQAQKDKFAAVIQKLFDQGVVASTTGDYFPIEDFLDMQAQLNYFVPRETGYEAGSFVISADMKWTSASMKANWPTSGCGIVYGRKDGDNQILTFLGLDGYVYTFGWIQGASRTFAFRKWGTPVLPEGSAKTLLVVWEKRVTIYVNDIEANQYYNGSYKPGKIALTVISGTNAGFGTMCAMKNVELWIFKE
jgi:hypothetical protein